MRGRNCEVSRKPVCADRGHVEAPERRERADVDRAFT